MKDSISYGTPDQFTSLLQSIRGNVDTEPVKTWEVAAVEQATLDLMAALRGKLAASYARRGLPPVVQYDQRRAQSVATQGRGTAPRDRRLFRWISSLRGQA